MTLDKVKSINPFLEFLALLSNNCVDVVCSYDPTKYLYIKKNKIVCYKSGSRGYQAQAKDISSLVSHETGYAEYSSSV